MFIVLQLTCSVLLSEELSPAREALQLRNIDFNVTAYFKAIGENDTSVVNLFLSSGATVDTAMTVNGVSRPPLVEAAEKGAFDVAQLLLEKGANPDSTDGLHQTALMLASAKGNLQIVKLLVSKGANVNARAINRMTPLHFACAGGHREVVRFLLDSGADVNARDSSNATPLLKIENCFELVPLLVERGADIGVRDVRGESIIMKAIDAGALDTVKYLAGKGADLNILDGERNTPLIRAVLAEDLKIVKWLLGRPEVRLEHRNSSGKTAYDIADERKNRIYPIRSAIKKKYSKKSPGAIREEKELDGDR